MNGRRKYESHFPTSRLYEIYRMIENFEPQNDTEVRDKEILKRVFIDGRTTKDIVEQQDLFSKRNKPISQRRIQQIILQYVPDYRDCRKKEQHFSDDYYKMRTEQAKIRKQTYIPSKTKCAICGCKEKVELHHMIPLLIGGTNDKRNSIYLCKICHTDVTNYFMEIKVNLCFQLK